MSSLTYFPCPQTSDERTLREVDECIETGPEVVFNEELYYPSISINPKSIIKPSIRNERASNVFVDNHVSPFKKAFFAFRRRGFLAAMDVLSLIDVEESIWRLIVRKIASGFLHFWSMVLVVYGYFYPYSLLTNDELCSTFSRCLDYTSHIRCFAWHPKYSRCAIALSNDNVFVYSSSNSTIPLVMHPSQKKVTDLAWKPSTEEILAVACQSVVIIWALDPKSKSYRATCARVISHSIPTPVTCIAYDPVGDWLGVCSPASSKILLIKQTDVIEEKTVRKFGSGVTFLKWSPDKMRLMTATTCNFIRIFEKEVWSSKKWAQNFGNVCQSACWSQPDGRILLFALKNDCFVYAVAFYDKAQANDCGGTNSSIEVLDVSEHQLANGVTVGGPIHEMLWDKNSERLAIMFKDNPSYIAVYKTQIKPNLEVSPIGFIHGLRNEIPVVMCFHDAFKKGSLLSICWNSGFVSHIPFQYTPNSKSNLISHSTPRSLTSFCVTTPTRDNSFCSPLKNLSNISRLSCASRDSVLSPRKPMLFSQIEGNIGF